MTESLFKSLLAFLGVGFAAALAAICIPPLIETPDLFGAIAGGFVNPYASAYALDAILCWCVLALWVVYEAKAKRFRHGWVALILGVVPGVTTGFAVYLLIRLKQESRRDHQAHPHSSQKPGIRLDP